MRICRQKRPEDNWIALVSITNRLGSSIEIKVKLRRAQPVEHVTAQTADVQTTVGLR